MPFTKIKQYDQFKGAPTCIEILLKHYNCIFERDDILRTFQTSSEALGVVIQQSAEKLGIVLIKEVLNFSKTKKLTAPCIYLWNDFRYVVIYKISNRSVWFSDPGPGITIKLSHKDFFKDATFVSEINVLQVSSVYGNSEIRLNKRLLWDFVYKKYIKPFKTYYYYVILGMLINFGLSIIIPFLTKAIVDEGIAKKDLNFINLILLAQIMTMVSSTMLNSIQNWLFLHMSVRMNISVVSDFISKILKLPVYYFDSSRIGDMMQRIGDHGKLKAFVSAPTLATFFSFFNLLVFGGILIYYNVAVFFIFAAGSVAFVIWTLQFMKRRKLYDYMVFEKNKNSQNYLIELINGIRDIKLQNIEQKKRWGWEEIQVDAFKISYKQLLLSQYQQIGSFIIDTTKNILITFITARAVINGDMTLGMMLSIQYILGQLGIPINQFINFNNSFQDAEIGIERINDVYLKNDEPSGVRTFKSDADLGDVVFENVDFSYTNNLGSQVLHRVNMCIPRGKFTAIVGESGSGKSTILKLILKLYEPDVGEIHVGDQPLKALDTAVWRDNCSSVMQEGFIFNDTLFNNVVLGSPKPDFEKFYDCLKAVNLTEYVNMQPEGAQTILKNGSNSLSQGQKQRILIARSLYKDSPYIFLDEPTSALDARNERMIIDNLLSLSKRKTLVMISHKISNIMHADRIIVMENGKLVEIGDHESLMTAKGRYYEYYQIQNPRD